MDPADSLQFLARYGLVIIPALVVAEQFGIPLPAVPALLGVGALAAAGQVSIPLVLGTIAAVALSVDFVWYELGRRRGADVLAKLCRTSPDSDSCVRRAKHVFARYGAAAMLVAKFVPGQLRSCHHHRNRRQRSPKAWRDQWRILSEETRLARAAYGHCHRGGRHQRIGTESNAGRR
jgi:hypothetical protein